MIGAWGATLVITPVRGWARVLFTQQQPPPLEASGAGSAQRNGSVIGIYVRNRCVLPVKNRRQLSHRFVMNLQNYLNWFSNATLAIIQRREIEVDSKAGRFEDTRKLSADRNLDTFLQ